MEHDRRRISTPQVEEDQLVNFGFWRQVLQELPLAQSLGRADDQRVAVWELRIDLALLLLGFLLFVFLQLKKALYFFDLSRR